VHCVGNAAHHGTDKETDEPLANPLRVVLHAREPHVCRDGGALDDAHIVPPVPRKKQHLTFLEHKA
jgi:hypothetical protein